MKPKNRVGTLIRNKNLESNFLTLGIRFQFKVPHLGEGFEFNISHERENFKPSDHEVMHLSMSSRRGQGRRGIGRDFDRSLWPGGRAFEFSCCPGGRDI